MTTEHGVVIAVDRDRCVGHGRCYDLHPQLFTTDDLGFAVVNSTPHDQSTLDAALDASLNCPERAISVQDRFTRS
ncbi:ferredoxin [Rhodococcus sp. NPDC059968]|uniref:ferredoxin n=1 Tax=Rhodococcus sp. NPDC059968 TaxID=3347017 RepID=UPI00367205D0